MRVVDLVGDAPTRGQSHGSQFADQIRQYLDERVRLAAEEGWSGGAVDRKLIVETAETTLAAHQTYAPDLHEEMLAMAASAEISPAEAVVVGGFTDLVDTVRSRVGAAPTEDNCTAIINPGEGFLAQTWDMHASAGEYVVMFRILPEAGPAALVQTTMGCLGQIGMNEAGIAIGINNLTSWGQPGVTWPTVVRRVLQQTSLDDAVNAVLDAKLAGGHNFLILGPDGEGANIEAMPQQKVVSRVSGEPFVHSNHCLSPLTVGEQAQRLATSVVSSDLRLKIGTTSASDLDAFFASPDISRHGQQPHEIATCGAVVMRPETRQMRAVWGVPGDFPWEEFEL